MFVETFDVTESISSLELVVKPPNYHSLVVCLVLFSLITRLSVLVALSFVVLFVNFVLTKLPHFLSNNSL